MLSIELPDPPLVGLGLLAVRDTAAFLRFGAATRGQPCAGALERAYVFGVSQSGRFLRHLLYLGPRRGRARALRVRRASSPTWRGPGAASSTCASASPRSTRPRRSAACSRSRSQHRTITVSGRPDGLLQRLQARGGHAQDLRDQHVGRVLARRRVARPHRRPGDPRRRDAGQRARLSVRRDPAHARRAPPAARPIPTPAPGTPRFNVVDYAPLLRAALVNLDRWVSDGVDAAPSAVPRLADGTAVPGEATRAVFDGVPGVRFPDHLARPVRLDFGPDAERGIVSELPPKVGAPYRDVRLRRGCRRQRDRGHPAARASRRRSRRSPAGIRAIPSRERPAI